MAEKPQDVKVVEDSGWTHNAHTSIPRRGINDYERTMTFAAKLTDDQLKAWCRWLESDNCPGWTGVRGYVQMNNAYKFTTTYDSSD
jgi:hypothetical protein